MDFKVGENQYRTVEKLDCFDQFEIVRKLAPIVGGIANIDLSELHSGKADSMTTVLRALSAMPKADIMAVVGMCFKAVHRVLGQTSSPLWVEGAGLMYRDIGMSEMLMICYYVVKDNLENFIKGLPSTSIQVLSQVYQQGADQLKGMAAKA